MDTRRLSRLVRFVPWHGHSCQPTHLLPGARAEERVFGWTRDGRSLYVGSSSVPVRAEICDIATGARRPWKEITPPDPAGVLAIGPILISPDGSSYIYSYRRLLEDLYLVTGLTR